MLNDDISKKAKAAAQQLLTLYEKQVIKLINIRLNNHDTPWRDLVKSIEDYELEADGYSIRNVMCKTNGDEDFRVDWILIEDD